MGSWVYFHALVNKAWEVQTSSLDLFWKKWHGKVILVHHISRLSNLVEKHKGMIGEVVMVGQDFIPFGHKFIFLSIFKIWKWFWWLWVLVIILNNLYLQIIGIGTRSLFKIVKVPQGIFLDLGARVLNFREAYFAHILVFLSDSKNMLLFKWLSINTSNFQEKFVWRIPNDE